MPGVIPLEDAQDMYTSRLQDHANGLFQQAEAINQPPLQNVSPEAIPAEAAQAAQSAAASLQQHAQSLFASPPEPAAVDDATQSLQQHAQSLFDAAQSANQPPLQGVDPVAAVLGAAEQAGADMGQFAQTLSQHLQTAGGDVTSAALGAAEQSGANMSAFTGALNAALPQASTAATPTSTTPAGGTATDTGPATVGQGRSDFIQSLKPLADATAQKYGLDGNTLLAIAANETGWGQSSNAQQQNNLFSIQGDGSNGSRWASYKSPQESFDAFVNLISGAPRYRQAWADRTDPAKFVDDLRQAGYVADEPGFPAQGWVDQVNAIQRNLPQAAGAAASALGSAAQGAVQGVQDAAQQGLQAVNTTVQAAQAAVARAQPVEAQRQFEQEAGLSAGDAYTACGPVAAAAFAKTYGRNPTPSEAIALARQVGWNPNTGMAGVGSEVQLLKAMGIDAHATTGVDWANVGRDASAGNPVIIDTPGHYYYVDGYNQQTGELHVGASGLALRGGSEWMTPDQINRMPQSGGAARAAVFADHPLSGAGIASQVAEVTGNVASAIGQKAQDVTQAVQQVGQQVGQDIGGAAQQAGQDISRTAQQTAQSVGGALNATVTDPNAGPIAAQNQLLRGAGDVAQQLATEIPQHVQHVADQLQGTPALAIGSTLRGPELLSDQEIIDQSLPVERDSARDLLTRMSQASAEKTGATPEPVTDADVADYLRTQRVGTAAAQMNMPGMPGGGMNFGSVRDALRSYQVGNMIAAPATLAHVAANSAIAPVWSLATRGIEDLSTFKPQRVQGSLVGAQIATTQAFSDLARGFSDVYTRQGAPTSALGKVWASSGAMHNAMQEAASSAIKAIEYGRNAGEEASALGLQGQSWLSHVANRVAAPSSNWLPAAESVANRATLRGQLGSTGQWISKAIRDDPTGGVSSLFPIFRIGMNHLTQMIEASPLGAVGTAFDVARAPLGQGPYASGRFSQPVSAAVTPLRQRFINNAIGTSMAVWLASKTADGTVTGDGPLDPDKRRVLESQGWLPNAVRVPGLGYVPSSRFPPEIAGPLLAAGAYADAMEAYQNPPKSDPSPVTAASEALLKSTLDTLASETPVRTIGDIWDMVHGQGDLGTALKTGGASTIANYASSYVPMGSVLRGAALAGDTVTRKPEPGNIGQYIEQNIPGLRQNVPAAQDVLGRTVPNQNAGAGAFLPKGGSAIKSDPVLQSFSKAGIGIASPPSSISYGTGQAIQLTPQEKAAYARAMGQQLTTMLGGVVSQPNWSMQPPETQRAILQAYDAAAREYANSIVLQNIPAADRAKRAQVVRGAQVPVQNYLPSGFTAPEAAAA